jgi:hypothetical protein
VTNTCQWFSYDQSATDRISMPRLFHIANKRGIILACQEATELLKLVKDAPKARQFSDTDFDRFVDELRYEHAFGRLLTRDEEIELENRPDIILVDD